MNSSTVIFTVIPDQAAQNPLRATVLVSPRLFSDQPFPLLGDFDFGSVPWPQRVGQMASSISVRYNGGLADVPVTLAPPVRPVEARDVELWKALFPANRAVIPFVPDDDTARDLRPFPAAAVAKVLLDLYK